MEQHWSPKPGAVLPITNTEQCFTLGQQQHLEYLKAFKRFSKKQPYTTHQKLKHESTEYKKNHKYLEILIKSLLKREHSLVWAAKGVSSCPSSQLPGPAIKHQSPDPSQQLLTGVLPANIHPQSCPYPDNSQVTVSPCPSQLQHRDGHHFPASQGKRVSCFLRQGRLLAKQQEQGKFRVTRM